MNGEMLIQLRKNMDKKGDISPDELRMMGAAIADIYELIAKNPMITYGNWLHKQPLLTIIITCVVLVTLIASVDAIGVSAMLTFLFTR